MTPEQTEIIKQLRDQGYVLAVFSPEDLRGANHNVVQNSLAEQANDLISQLGHWIRPDKIAEEDQGNYSELDIVYDETFNVLACSLLSDEQGSERKLDPARLNQNDLKGSYVKVVEIDYKMLHRAMVKDHPSLISPESLRKTIRDMGMGYGADLGVVFKNSDPGPGETGSGEVCIRMRAVADNRKLTQNQFNNVENKWLNVGECGEYKIWVRREDTAGKSNAINIYQCTKGSKSPSNGAGGYPVLASLLELKQVKSSPTFNEFNPPKGWICASEHSKDCFDGAIFECIYGGIDQGFVRYDMTIAFDGEKFIPIHGSVKMEATDTVSESANKLHEYWIDLPNEHKLIWRPLTEREHC